MRDFRESGARLIMSIDKPALARLIGTTGLDRTTTVTSSQKVEALQGLEITHELAQSRIDSVEAIVSGSLMIEGYEPTEVNITMAKEANSWKFCEMWVDSLTPVTDAAIEAMIQTLGADPGFRVCVLGKAAQAGIRAAAVAAGPIEAIQVALFDCDPSFFDARWEAARSSTGAVALDLDATEWDCVRTNIRHHLDVSPFGDSVTMLSIGEPSEPLVERIATRCDLAVNASYQAATEWLQNQS